MFKFSKWLAPAPSTSTDANEDDEWKDWDYGGLPYADELGSALDYALCRISIEKIDGRTVALRTDRTTQVVEVLVDWAIQFVSRQIQLTQPTRNFEVSLDRFLLDDGQDRFGGTVQGVCTYFAGLLEITDEVRRTESWDSFLLLEGNFGADSAEKQALGVTVGNLLAALGQVKFDRALTLWAQRNYAMSMANIGMAWHCANIATQLNERDLSTHYFVHHLPSLQASKRSLLRYRTDPKQSAKRFVFECWKDWQVRPEQYASGAEFARAMQDKFPDTLKSQPVISGWLTQWKRSEDT